MFNEMGHQPPLTRMSDFKTGGLDKAKLEVHTMVDGLYYDLQVDYATQLWQGFGNNIANISVVNGVSCAHYLSLILQFVYEKEGILVMLMILKLSLLFIIILRQWRIIPKFFPTLQGYLMPCFIK